MSLSLLCLPPSISVSFVQSSEIQDHIYCGYSIKAEAKVHLNSIYHQPTPFITNITNHHQLPPTSPIQLQPTFRHNLTTLTKYFFVLKAPNLGIFWNPGMELSPGTTHKLKPSPVWPILWNHLETHATHLESPLSLTFKMLLQPTCHFHIQHSPPKFHVSTCE